MADQKVSNLPALNGADVDSADLLYIVDSSAGTAGSKKITIGQYQLAPYSAATANTVVYFNGTKVPTSSSALTFDGTNLGVGTSSPGAKLEVASGKVLLSNTQSYAIKTAAGASCDVVTFTSGDVLQLGGGGATNSVQFWNQGLERMRLDASGNLGLGVTPSAQGVYRTMQFGDFLNIGQQTTGTSQAFFGWNVRGSSTANQYLYNRTGDKAALYEIGSDAAHRWYTTSTNGTAGNAITFTQAMTLTSGGSLVVGSTTANRAGVTTAISVEGSSTSILEANVNSSRAAYLYADGGSTIVGEFRNFPLVFRTNDTERARITSDGNLLVGLDSSIASDVKLNVKNSTSATATSGFWNATTTGDSVFVGFGTEAVYTSRGNIDYNRAGGLVRYNTTSDYRAKDILGPVANPGATIDALKVYEGKMKGATQSRPMLVAHEAQEHAPYAVSGIKDEVNADGTPKYQQMDVSSLVPLLIAEIQSLRARVAALEAK
jgi:hypothetical protein